MNTRSGMVQTVLGLVDPEELGHTHTHEHLLIDLRGDLPQMLTRIPDAERHHVDEDVQLGNLAWIRRHLANNDNLRLSDTADAIEELRLYREAGGGTVADVTTPDIGRDPVGLKEISEASGVHVVMGSGYYKAASYPPEVREASVSQLAEWIAHDVLEGPDGSGVRAGIIGEIAVGWPPHPDEDKVLRAAAAAQTATGVALLVQSGHDPQAPIAAIEAVRSAGGDPERTIAAHLDRTHFTVEPMLDLAATGCYLAFDFFGEEASRPQAVDFPNDAGRVDYLIALVAAGYSRQLLISVDACFKTRLTKYGGYGYAHILDNVIPLMRAKGMSDADIRTIVVENPKRVLTVA
jgi:phosphotriesterase-related protein